jgi:hypothetical protein
MSLGTKGDVFMKAVSHIALGALLTIISCVDVSQAALDANQMCVRGRYRAAAKYESCQRKAESSFYSALVTDVPLLRENLGKCVAKYTATWPKLQSKSAGSGNDCDNPRFVDVGNGTVRDNLTGLQWEKKTTDAGIHDQSNAYEWNAALAEFGSASDSTLFTTFLDTLNGGCFAGNCDWRIPTSRELFTILLEPEYPCSVNPCIDPIFGPTVGAPHWSGPGLGGTLGGNAFILLFNDGLVDFFAKQNNFFVRAVRGGL